MTTTVVSLGNEASNTVLMILSIAAPGTTNDSSKRSWSSFVGLKQSKNKTNSNSNNNKAKSTRFFALAVKKMYSRVRVGLCLGLMLKSAGNTQKCR